MFTALEYDLGTYIMLGIVGLVSLAILIGLGIYLRKKDNLKDD